MEQQLALKEGLHSPEAAIMPQSHILWVMRRQRKSIRKGENLQRENRVYILNCTYADMVQRWCIIPEITHSEDNLKY